MLSHGTRVPMLPTNATGLLVVSTQLCDTWANGKDPKTSTYKGCSVRCTPAEGWSPGDSGR